jgi:hypothetical protein
LQTQSARFSMHFSCIFHASISNPLDPTHDQADTPRPWHASPWCLGCWVCRTDASPDVGPVKKNSAMSTTTDCLHCWTHSNIRDNIYIYMYTIFIHITYIIYYLDIII